MNSLDLAKGCDLHLHILGAYHTEDLLELGKDYYQDIDWNENDFIETYQRVYGKHLDPIARFEDALKNGEAGLERLKQVYVYNENDGGDFARWEAKNSFFICVWSHWRKMSKNEELLKLMLTRHRKEKLDYVEYRCGSGLGGFLYWHSLCARVLQDASQDGFVARYILSLPRHSPSESYAFTQQLLNDHPDLIPTIVGIDFASVEEGNPPKHMKTTFDQVHKDNRLNPERALDIVYHVGESFFDKSLESAIRWCHEVVEMGVKRIGHAIALGLDPRIAVERHPQAHEQELVSERLDQIAYDLQYEENLSRYGVEIDKPTLISERERLTKIDPTEKIEKLYNEERLEEIHKRQQFVLDRLIELGTVIEACPTSNLRIGGVPSPEHHPIHRFLNSQVNLVICSDDPGNFDSTLSDEIDWILTHSSLGEEALLKRLGDPRRFRLGQSRPRN